MFYYVRPHVIMYSVVVCTPLYLCSEGEVTGLPAEEFCCDGKRYDVSAHMCCGGDAIDRSPNAVCCRGRVIDPNEETCEDDVKKSDNDDDDDHDDGENEDKDDDGGDGSNDDDDPLESLLKDTEKDE